MVAVQIFNGPRQPQPAEAMAHSHPTQASMAAFMTTFLGRLQGLRHYCTRNTRRVEPQRAMQLAEQGTQRRAN